MKKTRKVQASSKKMLTTASALSILAAPALAGVTAAPAMAQTAGGDNSAVNESFSNGVSNPADWVFAGNACLTNGGDANNCATKGQSDEGWNGDPNKSKGWVQLTSAKRSGTPLLKGVNGSPLLGEEKGAALYNKEIPAPRGLEITFDQIQGGGYVERIVNNKATERDTTRGADGIGFFLVDGAKTKTLDENAIGSYGASFSYASVQRDHKDQPHKGVDNGVIGLSLDSWGNFGRAGNTWELAKNSENPGHAPEASSLRAAKDLKGGEACVRDPRGNIKVPQIDMGNPLGSLGTLTDCHSWGLIKVGEKAGYYAEDKDWEPTGDVMSLRGPGNGMDGYALKASTGYNLNNGVDQGSINTLFGLKSFRANANLDASGIPDLDGILNGNVDLGGMITKIPSLLGQFGSITNLKDAKIQPSFTHYKNIKVTIDPKTAGSDKVKVTVAAKAESESDYPTQVNNTRPYLETYVPASAIPDTYKFGFSASTGAGTDVHAIRNVKVTPLPSELKLEKDVANKKKSYAVGDTIDYTFKVTNKGKVDMKNIAIKDDVLDSAAKCNPTDIAVGASTTCTGTHKLTEADLKKTDKNKSGYIENDEFVNFATATGKRADNGTDVESNRDDARVPVKTPVKPAPTPDKPSPTPDKPEMSLVKDIDTESELHKDSYVAGDKVPYTFTVKNTGSVKITNVTVVDDKADEGSITGGKTELEPGESTVFKGVHTLTEEEASQPEFTNTAHAEGDDPKGNRVKTPEDSETIHFNKLNLVKDVDTSSEFAKDTYAAGDKVPYVFTVTNNGGVNIKNVTIADDKIDEPATGEKTELAPGESAKFYGFHTLTEEEAAQPEFTNIAHANGEDPNGTPVKSNEDTETVPTGMNKLTLVKDIDTESELHKDAYSAGDKIPYTFKVTNESPVAIHDIMILDGALDSDAKGDKTELQPGETGTFKGTHTLTADEAKQPEFINVAEASGLDPQDKEVKSNTDDAVAPTKPASPLANTGASVIGLGVGALVLALAGVGLFVARRKNA